MSQFDFGTIDPYVVDGVQLADMLNNWRNAIHSWHRGGARPSYAVPGMMWINDAGGAANWQVMVYLSPTIGDVAMFTYNTVTGAIGFAGAAGGSFAAQVLLAQAAATPSVQWNATGNPIDAKNWRMTVNAAGALVLSSYTDAGVLQNSVTFNRDGSVSGAMRLYSEQVLAAAAAEMRVNIPAAAKAIEIWFLGLTTGNADLAHVVNGLNGAAILGGATHNSQSTYAIGANAAGQLITAATAFAMGTWTIVAGVLRPVLLPTQTLIGAQYSTFQSTGGARPSINYGGDGGGANPTGFRWGVTTSTLAAGSYLRCFAAV